MCIDVEFSDKTTDLIMAMASPHASTVLKGLTRNEKRKAVIILKDESNEEDTVKVLFHAIKDYLKLILIKHTVP